MITLDPINNRLDRLEAKIDTVIERISDVKERQARLEATQKGFATTLGIIFTSIMGYITSIILGHFRP